MTKVFRSKKDSFAVVFTWLSLLAFAAMCAVKIHEAGVYAAFVCASILVLWVFFGTYYAIDASTLVARCGPFTFKVPVSDVLEVSCSNSMRTAPALSFKRILIRHKKGTLLISPENPWEFIDFIQGMNPSAKFTIRKKPLRVGPLH